MRDCFLRDGIWDRPRWMSEDFNWHEGDANRVEKSGGSGWVERTMSSFLDLLSVNSIRKMGT